MSYVERKDKVRGILEKLKKYVIKNVIEAGPTPGELIMTNDYTLKDVFEEMDDTKDELQEAYDAADPNEYEE